MSEGTKTQINIPIVKYKSPEDNHPISIIVGQNGAFYQMKTEMYHLICKLEDKKFSFLEQVEDGVRINLPKIDYETYASVLSFFKEVYNKYKSESGILLTLKRGIPFNQQKYGIIVPNQTVGGAFVEYNIKDIPLEKDVFLAGSIHSHPNFSAFQSGTDHKDEICFDGIHITYGQINQNKPEIHERIIANGIVYSSKESFIETSPNHVQISFPEEWMKRVSQKTSQQITYVGGYAGRYKCAKISDILLSNVCLNNKDSKELISFNFLELELEVA